MDIFIACLCILCTLCFILYITTKTILPSSNDITFKNLQRAYLIVYILGIVGDWLQGPYVYVLYQSYGMTSHQIEILFVAGFGSSMIFGTLVGALADKYGRRFNCILYGILYGISCLTKHFPNFWILMIGRLFGGIATSILYSALESWLICESNSRGLDSQSLSAIFSRAYLGNSIVAIVSGLIAQIAVNFFGYVAPFDISFLVLMAMIVVIIFSWSENYGNPKSDIFTTFKTGFTYIKEDHKIFCLGITQSLFEGCMYTFVLEWTPSLSLIRKYDNRLNLDDYLASKNYSNSDYVTIRSNFMGEEYVLVTDNDIPHGYIFAGFMIAIMIGSLLFKVLSTRSTPESFMRYVLMISSSTFLIPILFPGKRTLIFVSYLIFEVCVGIFWPSIAMLRGKYIPEETRSTIMNIFRVPLNLIVIIILLQNLEMKTIFQICVIFLLLSSYFQHSLLKLILTSSDNNKNFASGTPNPVLDSDNTNSKLINA